MVWRAPSEAAQQSHTAGQVQDKESVGNPEDRRAGFFLEAHVSDGIAGMTSPAPPARVSTSEILIPLLLRP